MQFQTSLPADNIILNPANKMTDHSLFDFQTGIAAAAHATLDTEQLISHTRATHVDTIASLQVLIKRLSQPQNSVHNLLRFMAFWTVLST